MIPAEAVEAGARELFFQHSNTNGPSLSRIWDEAFNEDLKSPFMRDARAALEAAAPHMLADGQEAARTARDQARKLNAVISIAVRLDSSMQGADRELAEELYAAMGLK